MIDKVKKLNELDTAMIRIENRTSIVGEDGEYESGVGVHCSFIQWSKLYTEQRKILEDIEGEDSAVRSSQS